MRTFAKGQRRERTRAEDLFWQQVRAGRFHGLKFSRQVPIPPYIADFLCASARLIVELDGEPHETDARRRRDAQRDAWLKSQGFEVLRFPNDLVLSNLGLVLDRVGEAVEARALSLPRSGGREMRGAGCASSDKHAALRQDHHGRHRP
ncbi:endonuclease domain-containing protein [Methylobacterium sp. WL2]|uniref:endonuclease domain-containing protein n=1 Tax=Methylobacterium sp. WL2 TaxID=2603902 RepID=UPI001FEE7870|nr:endonuclease domain-containing protein [Methylobacterium sp. WL2]